MESLVDNRNAAPGSAVVVAIPTLNEEESIGEVVHEIAGGGLVHRIVVADGGSRDRTTDMARAAGAEVLPAGKGYGRACLAAAHAANEGDIVVFMDGDGADDPNNIASLIDPIRSGEYDFVIGSRARGKHAPGSIAWYQFAAGFALGLLIRFLYGVRYTDMCAFRAIRRDALLSLGMEEMSYGWNIEMQIRAARAHLRIQEIPVSYRQRLRGRSKVAGSFRGFIRASIQIVAAFIRIAISKRQESHAKAWHPSDVDRCCDRQH